MSCSRNLNGQQCTITFPLPNGISQQVQIIVKEGIVGELKGYGLMTQNGQRGNLYLQIQFNN